jgi:hypothetical protein
MGPGYQTRMNEALRRAMKVVPASEAWVHEPRVQYQLKKAGKWLKDAPRTETSIDALQRKGRKRK